MKVVIIEMMVLMMLVKNGFYALLVFFVLDSVTHIAHRQTDAHFDQIGRSR